jgi:protein-S-isoprenylcysteine O-methyltransferase Ste14
MTLLSLPAPWIYAAQAGFWGAFVVSRLIARSSDNVKASVEARPSLAAQSYSARRSRAVVWAHAPGFLGLYAGIGIAVSGGTSHGLWPGQAIAGLLVIACATALCSWALLYFRSWRLRATVDVGHQLATGGPFRLVRHPIYTGFNLLALGSALWIPTPILWFAFLLMIIGSDVRARTEETLLEQAYGAAYASYRERTRRFVPGVY